MKSITRELAKHNLDLEGVQEVCWNKGDIEPAKVINFSMIRLIRFTVRWEIM
jgi:hypothetical protein